MSHWAGDHLRSAELGDQALAVALDPADRPGERIVEPVLLPGQHRGGDRQRRHVLRPTGDNQVLRARHHALRGEVDGLLRGTALAVDRDARHFLGEPGGQPAGPADVAGLRADRVDAAPHDVIDRGRVDARAVDQRGQHVRAQVDRVHLGKSPTPPTDGSTDCLDDVGLGHDGAPSSLLRRFDPKIRHNLRSNMVGVGSVDTVWADGSVQHGDAAVSG
jgi:hypothetical protein